MENSATVEELANLTFGELKLVNRLLYSPERSSFVNGESSGLITSLFKKGIVDKVIRVGRVWKWRIKDMYSGKDERKFVKERLWLAE